MSFKIRKATRTMPLWSDPDGTANNTFANDDASTGPSGEDMTGNITTNDNDPEGEDQDITEILVDTDGDGVPEAVTPVAGIPTDVYQDTDGDGTPELIGTISVNPETGDYTWSPETGFVGTAVIPYTTTDGMDTDDATLYLTTVIATSEAELDCPDLSPIITVTPGNIQGISALNVVVDVAELIGVNTDGLITVRIPSDPRLTFNYDNTLTTVGFSNVDNADWTYNGNNGLFHVFTTTKVVVGKTSSYFGFIASYDPQNTDGTTTMTATIVPTSGGECIYTNNTDAEFIIYFE